jgi:hypothetical protein
LSASGAASVWFGVPCRAADLVEVTGSEHRCERGHKRPARSSARFCGDCGAPYKEHTLYRPATPEFAARIADFLCGDEPPADILWDMVHNGDEGPGLHDARARLPAWGGEPQYLVGFRIAYVGEYRDGDGACAIAPTDAQRERARKLAASYGLPGDREPVLFLQLYFSG